MWFRNLQIYRLPTPWAMTADALREQLARGLFVHCASNIAASRGWVSPRGDGELVHAINRQWMLALQTEKRLLPAQVINQEVWERAKTIETQQGYAPGRKQMKEIRERVTEELLPKSHAIRRRTFVWIDPQAGWFVVDASSPTIAEAAIEHLRHCLDGFPLSMLHTQLSPVSLMANWLAGGEAAVGFTIDRDLQLKATSEEKSQVSYKRHPLNEYEVKGHLAQGKLPTQLAITWDDRISFILTEKLEIKRLAFLDLIMEAATQDAEHAADQFDADFALMTGELARFIPALVNVLGGEVNDA